VNGSVEALPTFQAGIALFLRRREPFPLHIARLGIERLEKRGRLR